MGVSSSTPLAPELRAVQQWQWQQQVAGAIKSYCEQELPFGITAADVSAICDLKQEGEAAVLVAALARQPATGVVNALTVLAALILLGDELAGSLDSRIEALYDLVDFDFSSQVTHDELVVLFLCVGSAVVGLMKQRPEAPVHPDDSFCRRLADQLYQDIDKDTSDTLSKNEFSQWAISFVGELEEVNVDNVYLSLYHH
jgi:hypothetical protein